MRNIVFTAATLGVSIYPKLGDKGAIVESAATGCQHPTKVGSLDTSQYQHLTKPYHLGVRVSLNKWCNSGT